MMFTLGDDSSPKSKDGMSPLLNINFLAISIAALIMGNKAFGSYSLYPRTRFAVKKKKKKERKHVYLLRLFHLSQIFIDLLTKMISFLCKICCFTIILGFYTGYCLPFCAYLIIILKYPVAVREVSAFDVSIKHVKFSSRQL